MHELELVACQLADGFQQQQARGECVGLVPVHDVHLHAVAHLPLVLVERGAEARAAEVDARRFDGGHAPLQLAVVEERRADDLEGHRGAAALAHVGALEDAGADIAQRRVEVLAVRAGRNPRQVRVVKAHPALPAGQRNDRQLHVELQVILDIARILADGQRVLRGQLVIAHERGLRELKNGAAVPDAAQRVDAVEHDHGLAAARARLHGVGERVEVGVKARADVLNIEDQDVKGVQHLLIEVAVRAEGAVHSDARLLVHAGIHLRAGLRAAADAVLHSEQGGQVAALADDVDGAAQVVVDARRVGHEANALARKQAVHGFDVVHAAQYMMSLHIVFPPVRFVHGNLCLHYTGSRAREHMRFSRKFRGK